MGPKDWIYRQYDQRVGLRTVRGAGADFGILRLPDTGRALAVVTGCRPAVMRLDAHLGGQDAVLFPALQMAAKGFKAMAVTDCLNFGNPERVEVMSEFVAAVEGIAAASRIIDAPVISGNVSFYNETLGQNITPTPATGLVGLRDNFENLPCDHFKSTGLAVYLWRCPMVQAWARSAEVLGGNREWTGALNLERVQLFIDSVRELTLRAKPLATRVPGDGGLAQALMKMCRGRIGFKSHSEALNHWDSDEFFREHFYEVLFVVEPAQRRDFERLLQRANDELYGWYDLIGYSQEDVFSLRFDQIFDLHKLLSRRESAWTTAFPELQ
ncbi:MAG: AIR synthase related protein [Bdellovibrionaceae bacterium]|nr:AIR synthase related protein [Pseudobdellovibrionaceae bacterium]